MTVAGIVVAAGRGSRFGGPKATVMLGGRPMWEWARRALVDGGVTDVVVVGDLPGGIPGGERRRDSVGAGFEAVPPGTTHVIVHDAARPLASARLVERVARRLLEAEVDGVVPAIPVRDTVKVVERDRVAGTVARDGLVAVQTPQGFLLASLRSAHDATDDDATDDAELVERMGGSIVVVDGEETNLKVTFPGDLAVAEALLR